MTVSVEPAAESAGQSAISLGEYPIVAHTRILTGCPMPIIEIRRMPRSSAARAAIVGATRALETAFPVIIDEAVLNRLGKAVTALFEAEAVLALRGVPEAA